MRRRLFAINEDTLASMGPQCDHSGAFDEREMNSVCCGTTTTTPNFCAQR